MSLAALVVTLLVAVLHVGFFVLESVLWTQPTGRKVFRQSPENAQITKVLAANQGVYNLMLAVSLVWACVAGNDGARLILLAFVVAVGAYGAATVSPRILVLQALPAACGAVLTWLAGR